MTGSLDKTIALWRLEVISSHHYMNALASSQTVSVTGSCCVKLLVDVHERC